jgi:hypothetical protein
VFALAESLRLPSGVTLAGEGLSTVLAGLTGQPVIVSEGTADVTVRDLTIQAAVPLAVRAARSFTLDTVDVFTDGTATVACEEQLAIRDCRFFATHPAAAAPLLRLAGCRNGTVMTSHLFSTGPAVHLAGCQRVELSGNVIGGQGPVLALAACTEVRCRYNQIINRQAHGEAVTLTGSRDCELMGNLLFGGVRKLHADAESGGLTFACNLVTDDALSPVDPAGPDAVQATVGGAARVHGNILAPLYRPVPAPATPPGNVTRTFTPTGTSGEEWPQP